MSPRSLLRVALLTTAVCGAALFMPAPARAQVSVSVSIGVFRDGLSPYGRWVNHERYGSVWIPHSTMAGWRPYTMGQWVYTDVGWMWLSEEPFGWATYHYGRWYRDVRLGWVWVPDTVWSPAWVAWRSNDDYIGWAPLSPDVDVETDVAFEPIIEPAEFTFVRTRYLVEPQVMRFVEPPSRTVVIVRSTFNQTHFSVVGSTVINRGVPIERVEPFIGRAVPRFTVQASTVAGPGRIDRGRVMVYRPVSAPPAAVIRSTQGHPAIPAPVRPAGPASPPPGTIMPGRENSRDGAVRGGPPPLVPPSSSTRLLQDVQARHARERAELDRRHANERAHPPAHMSARDLAARHAAESNELNARQQRELRDLQGQEPATGERRRGR